jgi:HAE1 family hydrophobic/amphiphilic exporter-1
MSNFFLDRPVFAWVIAIAMMLAGGLAIYNLPISQYPPIAPPSIAISAFYPGASAKTVEDSVVQIIEQKMTGLDQMLYMSATSDSAGAAQLTLTFAPGTDPDLAWSKVQNKLQLAMPMLPEVVQRQGVRVSKSTRNYLLIVGLTSEDPHWTRSDLSDYLISRVENVLARVPGVGEVEVFGTGYAMRIWLDPDKLTQHGMTTDHVVAAVRAYNVEVSAGQFGGAPAVPGQRLNASILVQSLLKTPEEFAEIPLRTHADGSVVRVADVGRVALGTDFEDIRVNYDGFPATALAIRQAAGANALDTADAVKAAMADLSKYFPAGMKVVYPFDTTPFVRVAIGEVVKTLLEAIVLVFLVMYLFLGNLRATLVPTIAVPVVLLGTFGVLGWFGFSINMLTMFAMVLAIGLLVDDAIVVVENVERVMTEEGLSPREATRKSMEEIQSALVGIGLVLAAVFGPMAFFPGSTGVIYRQFSITVIASMLLSVVVALVLSPVLCAALLKPVEKGHEAAETGNRFLRPFFLAFDRAFYRVRDVYARVVERILGKRLRYLLAFALIVVGLGVLFSRMPTGYLPDEDQGSLLAMIQLPVGSTLEQTQGVLDEVQRHFRENERDAVASSMGIAGMSFGGRGQNQGMSFIKLRDWKERDRVELRVKEVAARAMPALGGIRQGTVYAFPPPAVVELGIATGFDFMLQDRGGLGHEQMTGALYQLLGMAAEDPRLSRVRPNGMLDVPQYKVDIDWEKAGTLGVPVGSIQSYLSASFGSSYVGDFVQGGRVKRVYAQADAPYRMLPTDLDRLHVPSSRGGLVPLSALASGRWVYGSPRLERYNGVPAMNIQGEAAPGHSTGEAMQAMEEIAAKLPAGTGFQWTGLSYQERMAESQAGLLYAFSILVVFLVLAALYESWTVPISIVLALPLGVLGGVVASSVRGLPNDVYFQIGLLTVLGLTTKNAILIVQFAKAYLDEGLGLMEATLLAAKVRLRPIVMTSLAFGFGVLPLALATGAGAGAQVAIGTSVLGGMISGTFLAVLFIPLFFVVVVKLFTRRAKAVGSAVAILATTTLFSGCTMIPKYTRPDAPVPATFEFATSAQAETTPLVPWREHFTDPRLQAVIETTLANNRDLRVAALNIQKAQAFYKIQRSELTPAFGIRATDSSSRLPGTFTESGNAEIQERASVEVGFLSWEIDFFGRLRSLKAVALEQYLATEQARDAVQTSLVASVASAWLQLAADQEALRIAQETVAAQRTTLVLIRASVDAGIASDLDLRQAESQVETARVSAAENAGNVALGRHTLDLLAGASLAPELLPDALTTVAEPSAMREGLDSEVLLHRPDIRLAEHRLIAANANIGAARAAFFPRISLTAAVGTLSPGLSGLFESGSKSWTFSPQAEAALFAGGRQFAKLKVAKIEREAAVAEYERAIQGAFAEVADALSLRMTLAEKREALEALVTALSESLRLSEARYNAGLDGYLGVLVAQRSLLVAQQSLVGVRFAEQANRVELYRVLGGGGEGPPRDQGPYAQASSDSRGR